MAASKRSATIVSAGGRGTRRWAPAVAIDFHSWRRWSITHAREAGFDRAIVAAIVGQEVGNITMICILVGRPMHASGNVWRP